MKTIYRLKVVSTIEFETEEVFKKFIETEAIKSVGFKEEITASMNLGMPVRFQNPRIEYGTFAESMISVDRILKR